MMKLGVPFIFLAMWISVVHAAGLELKSIKQKSASNREQITFKFVGLLNERPKFYASDDQYTVEISSLAAAFHCG